MYQGTWWFLYSFKKTETYINFYTKFIIQDATLYLFKFWHKNLKNLHFIVLNAVFLGFPEPKPTNFPAVCVLSRVFVQTSGTALYSGVFQLSCLNSAFPTLEGDRWLRGTWCELWRGVSQGGRLPQEAGLLTSGTPRPTSSPAEGLLTSCVEKLPATSRPGSLQFAAFSGAARLTQHPVNPTLTAPPLERPHHPSTQSAAHGLPAVCWVYYWADME